MPRRTRQQRPSEAVHKTPARRPKKAKPNLKNRKARGIVNTPSEASHKTTGQTGAKRRARTKAARSQASPLRRALTTGIKFPVTGNIKAFQTADAAGKSLRKKATKKIKKMF